MKRKSELYFEELGDRFDEFISDFDVRQRIRLIERLLPVSFHVNTLVEIGCGTGAISNHLKNKCLKLILTDLSHKLCRSTAIQLNGSGLCQDACRLGLKSNSVDMLISSEVIEHVPYPLMALSEFTRVVKPNGWVIITTPNRLWYPVLWIAQKLHIRKFEGNENWLFPNRINKQLYAGGMVVENTDGCHLFPWQIPGAKRILPKIDRWGGYLYPMMINYGVAARKRVSTEGESDHARS